ncbi:MAG: nucleotide exchange factor GrpE [Bacteroidota bacterium]
MNKDKKNSNEIKIERAEEKNEGINEIPDSENGQAGQAAEAGLKHDTASAEMEKLNAAVKELTDKISALEQENLDLKEKVLRKAAEFENYKRRTEKEKFEIAEFAAMPLVKKVLSVYDDLERSLVHITDSANVDAIKEGLNLVVSKFSKMLEEENIKKIDAKGKPFDFNFHEALLQQKAEGVEPHTVLEVVETGYTYRDKVIRHAKVIVSEE